jgi:hypothetical protein
MGVFKEEAHIFEQVAKGQRRIFNDACDYGYPYKTSAPSPEIVRVIEAIKMFQTLDKKFPDEKLMVRKRETWKINDTEGGVTVVIRIGWEIDNGQEHGSQYTISVNHLGTRYARSPNFLCHGSDAFMSVDVESYSEPK